VGGTERGANASDATIGDLSAVADKCNPPSLVWEYVPQHRLPKCV
jgi:hypothetical protein